jgi:hypothetical protein
VKKPHRIYVANDAETREALKALRAGAVVVARASPGPAKGAPPTTACVAANSNVNAAPEAAADDPASDVVALAREVGLAGFAAPLEATPSETIRIEQPAADDPASDVVALAREVGLKGYA